MNYGTAWMIRYCGLEQWREAYDYALAIAQRPSSPSTKMLEELREAYWDIREYFICDSRLEMVDSLDVLFDRHYIEIFEGVKIEKSERD